ncbi:MFS transporter [Kineosporia sp. NBRC 101731]|uniref:MFS transporter n=1 Tax=Kineosporia sp. NBRC 101731 TaxID=3032199 RepID=UPI0024A33040|nr:MFS transporter [Kineosporia sp. NBRC 101731]GLY33638.1 MFS transporter [Kineosporia sp. NBRC 101731]
MATPLPTETVPRAAWRMLGLGVAAQAAGTLLVSTPAYLIPLLHVERGLPLAQAGLLAAAPTFGLVLTLVLWGALADRVGERWVIAGGLALTAVFALAAAPVNGLWSLAALLVLAGAASGSTNSSTGKVVVGWFPRSRRGLAMGIRQMSQPLGVAVAALVVPPLAGRYGTWAPLTLAGVLTGVLAVACAVGIANAPNPVRQQRSFEQRTMPAPVSGREPSGNASSSKKTQLHPPASTVDENRDLLANPYRNSRFLTRIHLVSILLVVPQFTLSTFGLVWLTAGQGWNATAAGVLIAAAQFSGAIGRILIGSVSDRVGSRVGVLRVVAVSGFVVMLALAASGSLDRGFVTGAAMVAATAVSVADNGLAFTSVAEAAGPAWSGRALGLQNTGQFAAASLVGPAVGGLIALVGYPVAFAVVALAPLLSIPVVPAQDQHRAG